MDFDTIETVLGVHVVQTIQNVVQDAYVKAHKTGADPRAPAALRELLVCILASTIISPANKVDASETAVLCGERLKAIVAACHKLP